MAVSIYDALTQKIDSTPVLIEEIKPLKNEVSAEEKSQRIKKTYNRRKYSNKPKPNKDI